MYELMLKFGPEKLADEFAQQYIIEYGKPKIDKIFSLVKSSTTIESYVNTLVYSNSHPKVNDLQLLMNNHRYFRWSKEETLCLGALLVIRLWSAEIYDGYKQEQEELEIKITAALIDSCSRLKYNPINNFFHRFYRRLRLIESQSFE